MFKYLKSSSLLSFFSTMGWFKRLCSKRSKKDHAAHLRDVKLIFARISLCRLESSYQTAQQEYDESIHNAWCTGNILADAIDSNNRVEEARLSDDRARLAVTSALVCLQSVKKIYERAVKRHEEVMRGSRIFN